MTDLRTTLADLVRDLTEPYEHAETIQLRSAVPDDRAAQQLRIHRVRFPSLLDQLAQAVNLAGGGGMARGYESSPPAALDAIDLLAEIVTVAMNTLIDARVKPGVDTAARLRQFVGLELEDGELALLAKLVGHWVTSARLVTRWDVPAIRPRGSCPHCDSRGGIRVRLDPASAVCVDCRATWEGDGEIVVLANHIKWSNGELEPAEATA